MKITITYKKIKKTFIIPNEYYVIVLAYCKRNNLSYTVEKSVQKTKPKAVKN